MLRLGRIASILCLIPPLDHKHSPRSSNTVSCLSLVITDASRTSVEFDHSKMVGLAEMYDFDRHMQI